MLLCIARLYPYRLSPLAAEQRLCRMQQCSALQKSLFFNSLICIPRVATRHNQRMANIVQRLFTELLERVSQVSQQILAFLQNSTIRTSLSTLSIFRRLDVGLPHWLVSKLEPTIVAVHQSMMLAQQSLKTWTTSAKHGAGQHSANPIFKF